MLIRLLNQTIFTLFFLFSIQTAFAEDAADNAIPIEKLQEFVRVLDYIKYNYIDEKTDDDLFESAIKGMVSDLDPHSNYLIPKEQDKLKESTTGKFAGLGIVIDMKDGLVHIVSPIDDTPAYRAGLQTNDLIVKIDDTEVHGLTLEEAVGMMRGDEGTSVAITYVREGKDSPITVDIVRDIITIQTVRAYLLKDNIAYFRISSFQQPSYELLKNKIDELKDEADEPFTGIILDLRNNPGGLLTSSVKISNLFLEKNKLIVYSKGRIDNSNVEFKSTAENYLKGIPMVVLINGGSASASEIVAGALKDNKRAIIMGNTSFGKGSVQTAIELPNGYGLKLTTARYYTPSGNSIQAKGIVPDIELKEVEFVEKPDKSLARKESNLKGHLENEENEGNEAQQDDSKKDEALSEREQSELEQKQKSITALEENYFIYEAINLLKGISISKH